jgi:caffeoyl-CoA O-methyltransferase
MDPIVSKRLEEYAARHSSPESPLFKALARETFAKAKWPQMQVGHLEGMFLKTLVRMIKAKRVLEIGTYTGYSALSMAEGLSKNGNLITLDIDPVHTRMARKYWQRSPSGKKIKLILGPALASLKKIKGPFDFVFIDADKANYRAYWNAVLPKVRQGGVIAVDNVLWSGRVLKPTESDDHAIVKFNKFVLTDKRVDVVITTVRDGVTLAYKK